MPFCVNCGSPVDIGDKICRKCGNNPWKLSKEIKRSESGVLIDETPEQQMVGQLTFMIISLIVLVTAILLILSFSVWQVGVFSSAPGRMYEREVGGPYEIILGKSYHVYRTFDFGDFGIFVNIIGILMLIYVWLKVQREIKSVGILAVIISAFIFLIFSLFIFIFGFDDLLTYTHGNTFVKPTFMQQYAWIIEVIIFGFLGCTLTFLAERFRIKRGFKTSIYPIVMVPISYVLILVVILVYIFGLHNMLYSTDYTNYRANLAWIIESIVFGFSAFILLMHADKIRIKNGEKSAIPTALLPTEIVFFIALLIVYVRGVNDTFFILDEINLRWLLESTLLGIPTVLMMRRLDDIRENEGKTPITPHLLLSASLLLTVAAIFTYILGVHIWIYKLMPRFGISWLMGVFLLSLPSVVLMLVAKKNSEIIGMPRIRRIILNSMKIPILILSIPLLLSYILGAHSVFFYSYGTDLRWTMETLMFGFPTSALILLDAKISEKRRFVGYLLIFMAFILLLAGALIYIIGIHTLLYENWKSDLMWTVEIAMFLLPSIVFLYYCNKNLGLGRIIPYILIPLYSIMAISTILTYIIGSHYSLFYPRGDIDLRWMPETILFLIPTIICLIIAEKMRISKDRSILPFALTPIVYILLFSGIFVYILGIHKSLKISEMNLLWIIEVLIFITPAILFALIVDRIRIKRHKKSILIIPFYVIGFVFVIATLLRFIFGLNDFLYGDLKNLNWFIESVLYLIPGVLLLYVAESDIIDVKKPTKWLSDLKKIENLQ